MSKFKKILFVFCFVTFVLIVFVFVLLQSNPTPSSSIKDPEQLSDGSLPNYLLGEFEEKKIRAKTETFAVLYYTYTSDDHRNLTATGDYQTPDFQEQTLRLVENLEDNYVPNYSLTTTVSPESFHYIYQKKGELNVTYSGTSKEQVGELVSEQKVKITLNLLKGVEGWLVAGSKREVISK
jgi:hypothetical protein